MASLIRRISLISIVIYFALAILNLVYIPIAWIDEIMDLDPAMRFIKGFGYNSKLWMYEGSEEVFLANLPLRNLPFIIMGYLFGADVFWVRLPHILFIAGTAFFFWKLLKHFTNESIAWIILVLFLFDKGIYESLRSVRCEMQQLLYLSASLYFTLVKNRRDVAVFLSSMLALVHPASWVLSIGITGFNLFKSRKLKSAFILSLVYVFPFVLWLWSIDFNFSGIMEQLVSAGEDHTEKAKAFGEIFRNHFFVRFNNYGNIFFLTWTLVLLSHLIAIKNLAKWFSKREKVHLVSILLIAHSLFWMFILAPHYRYNPTMILLSYILVGQLIFENKLSFNKPLQKTFIILFILIQTIPFLGINFLGITQHNERNPFKAQKWLSDNIEIEGKTLICGESIGLYWIHSLPKDNTNIEYCAAIYPHKFDFNSYDKIYILTLKDLKLGTPKEYLPEPSFKGVFEKYTDGKSLTYKGMKLYEADAEQVRAYCLESRHGDEWE